MFFNHKVERLRYRTEVYIIWAWVSGCFSIGAVYKYVETSWSGSLVIAGFLVVLAIILIRTAKKTKQESIAIENQEIEQEKKEDDKIEREQNKILEAKKKDKLRQYQAVISKQKNEERKFLEEVKSRSLEENLMLLEKKYNSLPSKERMASYGEYIESIRWLKSSYKDNK
ncbi:MAG: hypothetical protein GY694_12565 [Gammaproteobacteria bacterium]|nr:hypothetical protein [Gammaproteobacteria bacterium]